MPQVYFVVRSVFIVAQFISVVEVNKKAKTHEVDMGRTPAKRKFNDDLLRVSRGASGQGLPYAPVDWPNSGDIWGWAVAGKGIREVSIKIGSCILQKGSKGG